MYAVKFHLKSHRDSRNKYSIMTGLNEPRAVVNTCVAIEFRHFGDTEKSTYILIRHKELAEHPTLIEDIEQGFKATFEYFD